MGATPALEGQTVVLIGGTRGIGLATARLAGDEGARLIIAARNAERLREVGSELGATTVALDATDLERVGGFMEELPDPVDHVLLTGPGPYYSSLADLDLVEARRNYDAHLLLPVQLARHAVGRLRPGGTLLFMSGTGGRRASSGALIAAHTAAITALVRDLALEVAPIRVNAIAAGFVDTPLSATLLGEQLDERREQLRRTLPIERVVTAEDVAALAVHLMVNTAITGATVDIDGGQQLLD